MSKTVNIQTAAMSCEHFKRIFYDHCPKDRIPELLFCLPDNDRLVFEAYLKSEADKVEMSHKHRKLHGE